MEIPIQIRVDRGGQSVRFYPALLNLGQGMTLTLSSSAFSEKVMLAVLSKGALKQTKSENYGEDQKSGLQCKMGTVQA